MTIRPRRGSVRLPDDLDDPSDASTPLVFDAVGLSMRGLTLLRDFSASVAAGETLAVMGPSGAGKTTLLRAIAGLVAPCAGSIRRAGRVAMVFRTRG